MTAPQGIAAVIFDMDGVLIDTEPVWRRIEVGVFSALGCTITEEESIKTMGVPIRDVVQRWHDRFPWAEPSVERVAADIVNAVIADVAVNGEPMRGVPQAFAAVTELGLPTAIASSSSQALIDAVVRRLELDVDVTCSADDEVAGKPDPGVFLRAAERLGIDPARCLAIEDSPNGVLAALAAGMVCAVIPDPEVASHPVMATAHHRLSGLNEVTAAWLGGLSAHRQVTNA